MNVPSLAIEWLEDAAVLKELRASLVQTFRRVGFEILDLDVQLEFGRPAQLSRGDGTVFLRVVVEHSWK